MNEDLYFRHILGQYLFYPGNSGCRQRTVPVSHRNDSHNQKNAQQKCRITHNKTAEKHTIEIAFATFSMYTILAGGMLRRICSCTTVHAFNISCFGKETARSVYEKIGM